MILTKRFLELLLPVFAQDTVEESNEIVYD